MSKASDNRAAAVERLIAAWKNPGSHPEYHERMKKKLGNDWPLLETEIKSVVGYDEQVKKEHPEFPPMLDRDGSYQSVEETIYDDATKPVDDRGHYIFLTTTPETPRVIEDGIPMPGDVWREAEGKGKYVFIRSVDKDAGTARVSFFQSAFWSSHPKDNSVTISHLMRRYGRVIL